ncbi:prolyl oligopeptidase family serine peptidase [Aeromicrobium fastidiosum]|uniref:prolyl oligopeptidase family serine peptidase n=1 Tax=Aeromicrobium fastidiosum TaxID=52699 RepID=UPI002023790F|nr:prolyl oligopeptidase family serine peptidase [Aeromicrobium fastidiosum]MCL8251752.1 prolyl oligopeptidase family serine peptidase [Aeromicrobium fastidiosum]
MTVSYPRLAARTLRFTLGVPRSITVSPDGGTVRFIRTPDGVTRTGQLWEHDVATGAETVLVDPAELLGDDGEQLSAEERSRRERSRESAAGLVAYDVDATGRWACFALSGRLWAVRLGDGGAVHALPSVGAVIDPRLDPTGRRIAYASGGALRVVGVDGEDERALVSPESGTEVWGQAEFIAAEEMDRFRGFWWAPDGESLLVERFDDAPVRTWFVADPENPEREPVAQRYPAAGTPNADVTLWHVGLDGRRTEIVWDRAEHEYLGRVTWSADGAPLLQVMSRDQVSSQVLSVDVSTGATTVLRTTHSDFWVELTSAPRWTPDGRLVTVEAGTSWHVAVDGEPVTPDNWQVRSIVEVYDDCVVATASEEPAEVQVVRFGLDGSVEPLTRGASVHGAVVGGPTTVVVRSALDVVGTTVTVHRDGAEPTSVRVVAEPAPFEPQVTMLRAGDDEIRTAVLFPRGHERGSVRLPVLMDPYGGPHAQRVLASARGFLEAQWLADQGFCVVVADGRGTPGRGPAWEHTIHHDFAGATLDDQVVALEAVAAAYPDDVDTSRVGITGWSYGGYLSALAVLKRPDVFHAAVAGAPVTEWRLYDTCYTERYLGDPATNADVYDRNSLIPLAPLLERPLMLIHGLADDNVVAAHTLRLSSALLAAGRAHTVLPLSGVTHMTPQEVVAENLKLLQVQFLKDHLGV